MLTLENRRAHLTSCILAMVLALTMLGSNAAWGAWTVVYQTDFSTDPGWTTNDAANLHWDAATRTYHGWQSNTNTSYAYVPVPHDTGKPFRLTYDCRIDSVGWSSGLTFGLWNSTFSYLDSVQSDYSVSDQGRCTSMGSPGHGDWAWATTSWATGVWYSTALEYSPATNQIRLHTWERDSGKLLADLLAGVNGPLPEGLDRLGVNRLFMEGYTTNAVQYSLDNVSFATPEPATLALLAIGSLGLLRRRRR